MDADGVETEADADALAATTNLEGMRFKRADGLLTGELTPIIVKIVINRSMKLAICFIFDICFFCYFVMEKNNNLFCNGIYFVTIARILVHVTTS
jgi:hypothetical protein